MPPPAQRLILPRADDGSGSADEAQRLQTIAVTGDGRILDAQIDTDRFLGSYGGLRAVLYRETQPPVAYGVLTEAALLPPHSVQALTLEYPESLPAEAQCLTFALQAHRLVSRPRELHPKPLAEPYVRFSSHTAPIVRTVTRLK